MKLSHAILTASAVAIGALAIVEAGRMQPPAFADTASLGAGGFTLITSSTGQGPDEAPYETLYVLDNRGEMLLVYGIDAANNRRLALRAGASLPALFRAARGG
jgi:hypothetical protein